jgi:hypothetical protein
MPACRAFPRITGSEPVCRDAWFLLPLTMLHLGCAATGVRKPVAERVFSGKSSGKGLLRTVFEVSGVAKHTMGRRFPHLFSQGKNAIVFEDRIPAVQRHPCGSENTRRGGSKLLRKSRTGEWRGSWPIVQRA